MARRLTYFILAGLVLGIVVGWAINACDRRRHAGWRRTELKAIAGYFSILTTSSSTSSR